MAGATNKSAKRMGYSKAQIQTERAKGGILSHAALMASGAPSKPTKAYKALAEAMAERKKGLTMAPSKAPAGWQKAARGEGKGERDAATAARAAILSERAGKAKQKAGLARTLGNAAENMRAIRKADGRRKAEEVASMQAAFSKAKRGDMAQRSALDVSGRMMASRKTAAANAKPSLERSLDNFKNAANKAAADYYAKQNFKNIKPPTLEFSDGGQRFIRVVRNDGTSKSAHSFIEKATGDIYKADSWKAPAKGVRGNIHKGEFNLDSSGQSRYSAAYEKRGTGPSKRPQWANAPIPKRAPAPGKASQADRAAIVAGRLLSRENMWGKVGAKDQRRANAILAKYPQVKDAARQLGKELNYRRAVRRGYGGDRKAFNMPSSGADVKRLVSIMR